MVIKKWLNSKKAQQTAEYALLIALVVGAVVAMQTYAQRALQGRIRDASLFLSNNTGDIGNTQQYEPYYISQDYTRTRSDTTTELHDNSTVRYESQLSTTRTGREQTLYNGDTGI